MRLWILIAALTTSPAWAATEAQEMNAVSKAWDRYALSSSQRQAGTAALVSRASLVHYGFLRDAALFASAEQLRRVPLADRALVYTLRATQTPEQLRALDGAAVAALCNREGWCGVSEQASGQLPGLSHVTLLGSARAIGEVAPPNGAQFSFGPEFVQEEGTWKVMPESLIGDESAGIAEQIKRNGMDENQMLQLLLVRFLGESRQAPALVTLERPPVDDAAARARLNETWPRYQDTYKSRVQALNVKSEQGDSFAQYVLGSLLMSGSLPDAAPQDEQRGWSLLEQASDGGNSDAAWLVATHLMADKRQYAPAQLQRTLAHLQRAAAAANPGAMASLGGFYFEGAGGLQRDCVQAANWQARAEEAGIAQARNEQVWTWATCPIPEQRDPAKAMQLAAFMIENQDTLEAGELDTVAAAYAANGQFEQAASFQQAALHKLTTDINDEASRKAVDATRKRMQARLRGYQNGKDYVQDYNTFEEMRKGNY